VLRDANKADAVQILKLNAAAYPDSANALDSLAEAYDVLGDTARAIANYEAALATLPRDPSPAATHHSVEVHATEQLERLRARR
jgi:predicted Zn-dependent protease